MSVIAMCSGKGSPGATFVAVNLAAALARSADEVLLLDLDRAGGDVGAYLGLDPRRGIHPLLRMNDRLPQTEALVREGEERGGVLAVAGFPEASSVDASTVAHLLRAARDSGKAIVADLGRVSDDTAVVAREADLVLLVVRPDLVSVLGAERALRALKAGTVPPDRLSAVISGLERRRPADVKETADATGIRVIGSVPLHRRAARGALVAQTPVSKGPLARAFMSLASTVRKELMPSVGREPVAEVATA